MDPLFSEELTKLYSSPLEGSALNVPSLCLRDPLTAARNHASRLKTHHATGGRARADLRDLRLLAAARHPCPQGRIWRLGVDDAGCPGQRARSRG